MHFLSSIKRYKLIVAIAVVLLLTIGQSAGQKSDKTTQGTPTQAAGSSQYVGSDVCKSCHEDMYKSFEATRHWQATLKPNGGPEVHGCEACHGPGSEHVSAGGDKTKIITFKGMTAEKISKQCLQCHSSTQEHGNFRRSMHATNDVSCIDCHSPHHAKEHQALLVQKQPELCYSCHGPVKADFSKPFRHRVNQGLLVCSDCHNEHGGFLSRQLRSASGQDAVCFKCHADKQGPFVFEHVPVKTEGCAICHVPHGSVNPRLLKVNQVNLLCLQCHTNISTRLDTPMQPSGPAHNQAQKYVSCTLCHAMIHGSNGSPVFFK